MRQVTSIQVLRAIAALVVVFGHAQHDAAVTAMKLGGAFARSFLLPWGAGVDLFFVISGFIMVYASKDLFGRPGASRLFLTRRFVRIVPLYWIFASAYLALQIVMLRLEGKPMAALPDIAASYLFLPSDTFGDGFARPFYTLGWTLNYEMFFYVCFAAFLVFPRTFAVVGVMALLTAGVVYSALAEPASVAAAFWTRPIVLEFAFGSAIALMLIGGVALTRQVRTALVVAATVILLRDYLNSGLQHIDWITPNGLPRVLAWGVPAAMIVAACALAAPAPQPAQPGRLARFGALLGDASYALYLTHPFVVVAMRKLALSSGALASLGPVPVLAATLALACLFALAVHRLIERPLTAALRARFEPRRTSLAFKLAKTSA